MGLGAVYGADAVEGLREILPGTDEEASGVSGWIQDAMRGKAEDAIRRRIPGDAGTVTAESPGILEDGDRLRQQAQPVVALAGALEQTPSPMPEAAEEPA